MKLNWKDSLYYSCEEDHDFKSDKEFIKEQVKNLNENLAIFGYLFLNEALDILGFKMCKRGQLDGWIFDNEAESTKIKVKVKEENGNLYLSINEEKDIIDYVFKE